MDEYFKKIEPGQKIECIFPENSLTGTLKIGDSVFSVYLGNVDAEMICTEQLFKIIHKFTLIECWNGECNDRIPSNLQMPPVRGKI